MESLLFKEENVNEILKLNNEKFEINEDIIKINSAKKQAEKNKENSPQNITCNKTEKLVENLKEEEINDSFIKFRPTNRSISSIFIITWWIT